MLGVILALLVFVPYLSKSIFPENSFITGFIIKETENNNEGAQDNLITGNVINLGNNNIEQIEEKTKIEEPDPSDFNTNSEVSYPSGPSEKLNVSVEVIG